MTSRDYHAHISRVHRTPTILTDVPQYPNAHQAFNRRVVYEEDETPHYHHRHHHYNPEERERVEVIEYKETDNYGNREVVYEEDIDVEESRRRNNGGFALQKWKTFRP